jgi:hypothetical protein
MTMMGMSAHAPGPDRMRRISSTPPIPGMMRSTSTTSNGGWAAAGVIPNNRPPPPSPPPPLLLPVEVLSAVEMDVGASVTGGADA